MFSIYYGLSISFSNKELKFSPNICIITQRGESINNFVN